MTSSRWLIHAITAIGYLLPPRPSWRMSGYGEAEWNRQKTTLDYTACGPAHTKSLAYLSRRYIQITTPREALQANLLWPDNP